MWTTHTHILGVSVENLGELESFKGLRGGQAGAVCKQAEGDAFHWMVVGEQTAEG